MGVGVGVADVGLGVGVGVELGEVVVELGEVGDGSALGEPVGLELLGDVSLGLGLPVSEAVELARTVPDDAGRAPALRAGLVMASSTALLGRLKHAAFVIGPTGCTGAPASAAMACPNMLEETNAKPIRAPTTAGLTTRCVLTKTSIRARGARHFNASHYAPCG